jgi:tellurite resistance protein TerC
LGIESIGSPLLWGGFVAFVLAMLALDLGVFHRKSHEVPLKEALTWSVVWIAMAGAFNFGIYRWFGAEAALQFATGYVIEKALSVDNLFVFLVIFSYFGVEKKYQHRVLFWGIIGALVMRAVFIGAGAALLASFHWIIYVFGALLLITGIRLLKQQGKESHPERNPVYRFFARILPATKEYRGGKFFVREAGKWLVTPLFLVLLAVEATDIVFAVDSIPAIFAVTNDPFLVFTSNIFAILGLRALYFLLAGVMSRFVYLKIGLSLVLCFVGIKMLITEFYKIPIVISLAVVVLLLGGSMIASLIKTRGERDPATKAA